ncbi:hypothetical protein Tco_1352537 [Tanacetum coccineum]
MKEVRRGFNKKEFSEEDEVGKMKHVLPKKMSFEMEGEDDWLGSFEVGRDEDEKVNYGLVAPSFIDIEDDMERTLAIKAYFNAFKNKVDGDGDWHARFEIVMPSGRKFNRVFKTKTTIRKLSGKFKTKDVLRSFGVPRVANWRLFNGYGFKDTLRDMIKLEYIYEVDGDIFVDYSWERTLSIDNEIYPEWGKSEDKILVPVPDLSQRPLKIEIFCLDCGDPVHGLYCRQCALIRKTLEEVFQDFQDTSKSSDDDTNFVNQESFVVKQGPGVNSSQSPPQINHNCCYECGDSLDDIFCPTIHFCYTITLLPALRKNLILKILSSLFPPSHIPVEDSDSLIEEIDIFLDGDDSIPPGIESDDFDSEDDDNSTFHPEFESFHDFPDCDDSRARGYVLHSISKLHILSLNVWGIQYPNLID